MVLLRHLLGDALRRLRLRQGRTLREVSASARVSLGYLSEVERGQKEASSELLSAICSALGAPLSQVLREVSDNFALAELQSEPVFTEVLEPAIEVAGVGHAPRRDDEGGEPVAVGSGPIASVRGLGQLGAAPGRLGPASRLGQPQLSADQLSKARKISAPVGVQGPLGVVGGPVFEQVSRTAREITNMVPV